MALFSALSPGQFRAFVSQNGGLIEQQMFLPHDGSAVALSWTLQGNTGIAAQLVVRPFFCGCGPRCYRDVGFCFDPEENGGRLTWLPNVRGPKVVADTNGAIMMNRCDRSIAFANKGERRFHPRI